MKWVVFFWALPVAVLGSWYALSYNDISFGWFILSRQMHDVVFQVYGNILGMPPEAIPPLVAKAIAIDSVVLVLILCFRRRRAIAAWWANRQSASKSPEALAMDDNLSSAP